MGKTDFVIETNGLTKKFDGLTAVEDLSLKIHKGEIFGFLGPNGAGKTTSIRMMVGLLKPTSGEVNLNMEEPKSFKEGIGICPQEIVLWEDLTAYENVHFMGRMYEVPERTLANRVDRLLDDLQLTDRRDSLASDLSGGMKRRLNLGMSLVHEPRIVVLDEPSAGLDPQSRLSLWEFIRRLRADANTSIILTTHLMEEANRLSDRVGIIDHGKLLVVDTPENLKKSVGEGDSLSIELSDKKANEEALEKIREAGDVLEGSVVGDRLLVRALDAIGQMGKFTRALEDSGFDVLDVSVSRTNTLEDVFIHLTGRGLRS
ncbi:ABC transporter ATP-binding protein [Candidatus Bipolaricaulota bacterium]|nr:ABC transporter ATP-binding protein [Candidatus Bipolaricaulota bacterium]